MRGIGILLVSSIGSFGIAVSAAILRKIFLKPRQAPAICETDEDTVVFSKSGQELHEPTTPLLKELRTESNPTLSYEADISSKKYGENFYSPGDAEFERAGVFDSPLSRATTDTSSLRQDAIVPDDDDREEHEFGSEQFEDASLEDNDSEEMEEQRNPKANILVFDEIFAGSSISADSQGSRAPPVAQPEPSVLETSIPEAQNLVVATEGVVVQKDSTFVNQGPLALNTDREETNQKLAAEAQAGDTPDEIATVKQATAPKPKYEDESAPVVVKAVSTKPVSSDIFAAPLSSGQVFEDPVSEFAVPSSAVVVQESPEKKTHIAKQLLPNDMPATSAPESKPPTGPAMDSESCPEQATEAAVLKQSTSRSNPTDEPNQVANPVPNNATKPGAQTRVEDKPKDMQPSSSAPTGRQAEVAKTTEKVNSSVSAHLTSAGEDVLNPKKPQVPSTPTMIVERPTSAKRVVTIEEMSPEETERGTGERLSRRGRELLFGSRRASRAESHGEKESEGRMRRLSQRILRPLRRSNTAIN